MNDESELVVNDYLLTLLDLQQDGQSSEIGPHNWADEPKALPIVTTSHVDFVNQAVTTLLENSGTGIWHFLVGAPGNGKSAMVGILVRELLRNGWDFFEKEKHSPRLTYVTEMARGDSGSNKYAQLIIIQDASVSESPFDPSSMLADELCAVLREAYKAGRSVLVCANRGVLEQLPEIAVTESDQQWAHIFKKGMRGRSTFTINAPQESKRPAFKELEVRFDHLDHETLIGEPTHDKPPAVRQLLGHLTSEENWQICASCPAVRCCPFTNNRKLLQSERVQESLLTLLKSAEVHRGQPIVFREIIALFSLILAGVPADYSVGGPCDWVQDNLKKNNILALLDRRLYQALFSGHSIANLSTESGLFRDQLSALANLVDREFQSAEHLSIFVENPHSSITISSDLREAIAEMDPVISAQDAGVADMCAFDSKELVDLLDADNGEWHLEVSAIKTWNDLADDIQKRDSAFSDEEFKAILGGLQLMHRISSMMFIRMAKLHDDFPLPIATRNGRELEDYLKLVDSVRRMSDLTNEEVAWLSSQQELIAKSVTKAAGVQKGYTKLLDNLAITNELLNSLAKPRISKNINPPYLTVGIEFGDVAKSHTDLTAKAYCWIRKTQVVNGAAMVTDSIPGHLLSGIRVARRNAISASHYLQEKKVALLTFEGQEEGRAARYSMSWNEFTDGITVERED